MNVPGKSGVMREGLCTVFSRVQNMTMEVEMEGSIFQLKHVQYFNDYLRPCMSIRFLLIMVELVRDLPKTTSFYLSCPVS